MKVFRKLLRNFNFESKSDEQTSKHGTTRNICLYHPQDGMVDDDSESLDSCTKFSRLHLAVLSERENEVKEYITKHTLNHKDALERTALHLGVSRNNPAIIRLLLAHGASVEIHDKDGFTPFLRVCFHSFHENSCL